ncbi:Copia protein [Phytophthora megakarya]|uniref:Copia protein n=1 Tax=Phytophthora megakarya TaxID=4795 RepID=A0A225V0V8_9STRA|nr:Copia protein [Phytophthora megakarya]
MEDAKGSRTPIGAEWNEEADESEVDLLPAVGNGDEIIVKMFQSLVGSLLWIARCTRPDIAFAVHKVTRRTHCTTLADGKLAKRIARYLVGTRGLQQRMNGGSKGEEALGVVGYNDADFAADKKDRKSVPGGLVALNGMPINWVCKKQGGPC